MEIQETKVYQVGQKYRICFEQAASTKGVIGFKCEANGDQIDLVRIEAETMLKWAKELAPNIGSEVK